MEFPTEKPAKRICKAILQHVYGISCPQMMWDFILGSLTAEDAASILDSLTLEEHADLRRIHMTRPLSFDNAVRQNPGVAGMIMEWLENDGDTPNVIIG